MVMSEAKKIFANDISFQNVSVKYWMEMGDTISMNHFSID